MTLALTRHRIPDRRQILARRNATWLHYLECGIYNPENGRTEKCSMAHIARLYGVTEGTVRLGIANAKKDRQIIDDEPIP